MIEAEKNNVTTHTVALYLRPAAYPQDVSREQANYVSSFNIC